MWRFHSYFEPVGKAQGIKRAVKLTIEGVNIFRLVVSRLYKDPHYFKPSLRSQTSKVATSKIYTLLLGNMDTSNQDSA